MGATLKRLRLNARLDQEHAAEAVDCSTAKISRIESGTVSARIGDVRVLLDLYGVEEEAERRRLEKLARDSNKRGWWLNFDWITKEAGFADFVTLETDASYIRTWQPLFIPGLLQTDDYLRTLLSSGLTVHSPESVEEVLAVRRVRRGLIEEDGARFAAIIWEPALTAPMPSAKVHREQLLHILHVAQRQNVQVQVLPVAEWRAAHLSSHFVMLSFGPEPAPEAVAYDTSTSTVLVEDLAEMAAHARIFEALSAAALTPDQSLAFVRKALASIPESEKEAE